VNDATCGQGTALVEILYSPACPQNAYFVACVRRWLASYAEQGRTEIRELRTDRDTRRACELLRVADLSQLKGNVFIEVFVNGQSVSRVPLHPDEVRNGVREALGLPPLPASAPRAWWDKPQVPDRSAARENLRYLPLTRDLAGKSLQLCLCRHPASGMTPEQFRQPGRDLKSELWEPAFALQPVLGVLALDDELPAGMIEVYPRRLARLAGFVTGEEHDDDSVLTVTCIEVAGGYPRVELIDRLMDNLLRALAETETSFRWLEGNGVYGWIDGTNPYWVFEKHGFARVQEIVPGRRVLMRRPISTSALA